MWVTKNTRICLSSIARTTCRAISEASRSLVDANDSLQSRIAFGGDPVGDVAHPAQLLVELAALHRGVLLALVVREHAGADAGAERLRTDEHAALHHQLSEAKAAQERRLPALVGAGDHHQRLAIGIDLVANRAIVQDAASGRCRRGLPRSAQEARRGTRLGEAGRLALALEPPVQVQAAEVERELEAEHA